MTEYTLPLFIILALLPASFAASVGPGCEPKCTFAIGTLTSKTITSFPTTCAKVCTSTLRITGNSSLTHSQLTTVFKNLKVLVGSLQIIDTKYTDVSFLAGLEKIESADQFLIEKNSEMVELGMKHLVNVTAIEFGVNTNWKLEKLNLPKLKSVKNSKGSYILIFYTHENFCVTGNELKAFMLGNKSNSISIPGKVCAPAKKTPKVCTKPAASCVELYGNLNIGPKFAVKNVKSLKLLFGSLIVKNTNLTNFKFLGNLTHIVQLNDKVLAIDVKGNKKLTNVALPKLQRIIAETLDLRNLNTREVAVFKNNHKSLLEDFKTCKALRLTMGEFVDWICFTFNGMVCEQMEELAPKKTHYEEEPKCIFREPKLNSTNIDQFPKCSKVCTRIAIDETSNVSLERVTSAFKNMKTLVGGVEIVNTNWTSLKCLEGLQKVETKSYGFAINQNNEMLELGLINLASYSARTFFVSENSKLKRMKLPKLKNFETKGTFQSSLAISSSTNANFCVTLAETKLFLNLNRNRKPRVYGKICKPGNPSKKVCFSPKVGCEELIGNLNIGAKFDAKKVKSLKTLYGSLIMKNTNFTNFKFLGNLTQIIQLNDKKLAIDVQNNKKLTSAAFPKLTRVFSESDNVAIFQSNHKSLLADFKSCYDLRMAALQDLTSYPFLPKFDGLNCEDMEANAKKSGKK